MRSKLSVRGLLLGTAVTLCLVLPQTGNAGIIKDLGTNPTSATGAFSNDPNGPLVGGVFSDQYTFQLIGGPQFITIASATNNYAGGPPDSTNPQFITGFNGSVKSFGADGLFGTADDQTVFGPKPAVDCPLTPSCQGVFGTALLAAGKYYLQLDGDAGISAGYGGTLSTSPVPAPIVGAGLPGLIMACGGLLAFARRRRKQAL